MGIEPFVVTAEDGDVAPELLAQGGDLLECGFQALVRAAHPAVIPHDASQFAVEGIDAAPPIDREKGVDLLTDRRLGFVESFALGRGRGLVQLVRQPAADRRGELGA